MKTLKNLLAMVLVSTITLTAYAAMVVPTTPATEHSAALSGQLVKATYVNGEWIPVVDLPEVEIIGIHAGKSVLKGTLSHGEIIGTIELPVIEITGIRIEHASGPVNQDETFEAIYDLPVIEIEASFPVGKLVKGESDQSELMAVIDLPEVVVSVNRNGIEPEELQYNLSIAAENGGDYLFSTSIDSEKLFANGIHHPDEKELKYYSVSVSNCIITEQKKRICELVLRMSNHALEGIRSNMIQIITQ